MNDDLRTKYSTDKIALLGLFVLSLIIAYSIVISRSSVRLSEPIPLDYSGLSVAMPYGNGWQTNIIHRGEPGKPFWTKSGNGFLMSSFYATQTNENQRFSANATCRYLFITSKADPQSRIKSKAETINGDILQSGQMNVGELTIHWASFRQAKKPPVFFFGTASLPFGRQLDIEVVELTGDTDMAETVFKTITEGIKFEDNGLLDAGAKVVAQTRKVGVDRLIPGTGFIGAYLVSHNEEPSGFAVDIFSHSINGGPLNVHGESYWLLTKNSASQERATSFDCDFDFVRFSWVDLSNNIKLTMEPDRLLTAKQYNGRASEITFQVSKAAVPEILLDFILVEIEQGDANEVIIDNISPEGRIEPVVISKSISNDKQKKLLLEWIDGSDRSETVFLDDQMQVVKKLSNQKITLEATTIGNIMRQFPSRRDYIDSILTKNQITR